MKMQRKAFRSQHNILLIMVLALFLLALPAAFAEVIADDAALSTRTVVPAVSAPEENPITLITEYNSFTVDWGSQKVAYSTIIDNSIDSSLAARALFDQASGYMAIAQFSKDYETVKAYPPGTKVKPAETVINAETVQEAARQTITSTTPTAAQIPQNPATAPECESCNANEKSCTEDECYQISHLCTWQENEKQSWYTVSLSYFKLADKKGICTTPQNLRVIKAPPKSSSQLVQFIYDNYGREINGASLTNNINPALIYGIIMAESAGNASAISSTGCLGLMQFCYSTASGYSDIFQNLVRCDSPANCASVTKQDDDRLDPFKSILAGARLIRQKESYFKQYNDMEKFGIAAYNMGEAPLLAAIKAAKADKTFTEGYPSWDDIQPYLTSNLLADFSPYNNPKYFPSYVDIDRKIATVRTYVDKVQNYKVLSENFLAGKS